MGQKTVGPGDQLQGAVGAAQTEDNSVQELPEVIEVKDLEEFEDMEVLASRTTGCSWK